MSSSSSSYNDERSSKLRRLDAFKRKLPYASESALVAILNEIENYGIPELHSRKDFYDAKIDKLDDTPYGKMILSLDVQGISGPMQISNINPLALLWKAYNQGGQWKQLVERRLLEIPSTFECPWEIILYADEVTPGNSLAAENRRKCWVIYLSFKQLGALTLQKEGAWMCISIQRSSIVAKISAGISQVYAALLKTMFCDGFDMRTGIRFTDEHNISKRVFFKLGGFLQDGDAHKKLWHVKGDAGTRFCALCINLIARNSRLAASMDDECGLVCDGLEYTNIFLATDSDIKGTQDRLRTNAASMTKSRFATFEQACGFNFEKSGILQDPQLKDIVLLVSHFIHDPMHALLSSGVFNTCMFFMLSSLSCLWHDIYERLHAYVQLWELPGRAKMNLSTLFTAKRAKANHEAHTFKCTASEALSLYSIMYMFLQHIVVPAKVCEHECKAFLSMCELIDMIYAIPLQKVAAAALQRKVEQFFDDCKAAKMHDFIHPKFHWLYHMPSELQRHGMLPSCFTHERKHRMLKRYMNNICNTKCYETSVLKEVCCHELYDLYEFKDLAEEPVMINQHVLTQYTNKKFVNSILGTNLDGMQCARVASLVPVGQCQTKDFVVLDIKSNNMYEAGFVKLHVGIESKVHTIVSLYTPIAFDAKTGLGKWQPCNQDVLVKTSVIKSACLYSFATDGSVKALVPLAHRC